MKRLPMKMRNMLAILSTGLVTAIATATLACTNTVIWNGEEGDWHDGPNWSSGSIPTFADCVSIDDEDIVEITQFGATCDELTLGATVNGSLNIWPGSSFEALSAAYLGGGGIGSIGQIGGDVNLARLEIGVGSYAVAGGRMICGSALVGTAAVQGAISITSGTWIVNDVLEVERTGLITLGGGDTTIGQFGTGGILLGGWLSLNVPFGSVTTESFTIEDGGVLQAFISNLGFSPIEVVGTATLDATLQIIDFGAAEGRYDVITAGNLEGTFTTVQLPDENWSWGIEGTTVWVNKNTGTPVQTMSLSEVKHIYR
jgi:hypothetical protein